MPQDKKPKTAARAARKAIKRMSGAEKRAKNLQVIQKQKARQERLRASKAKKRGVKKAPKGSQAAIARSTAKGKFIDMVKRQGVTNQKIGKASQKRGVKEGVAEGTQSSVKRKQVVRKTKSAVKKQSGPTPRKIKEKVTKRGRKRKVKY